MLQEKKQQDASILHIDEIDSSQRMINLSVQEGAIESYMTSISDRGLMTPLLVALVDGKYKLIDGFLRLEAMRRLGITEVRVQVREYTENLDIVKDVILSNRARKFVPRDIHNCYMKWREVLPKKPGQRNDKTGNESTLRTIAKYLQKNPRTLQQIDQVNIFSPELVNALSDGGFETNFNNTLMFVRKITRAGHKGPYTLLELEQIGGLFLDEDMKNNCKTLAEIINCLAAKKSAEIKCPHCGKLING